MSAAAAPRTAVFGRPPPDLVAVPSGAVQLSPAEPDAEAIEATEAGAFDRIIVLAPPSAVERRHVLAHALRALRAGGELAALAPKNLGGARIKSELTAFGCAVEEGARRHHRVCLARRPETCAGLDAAIAAGALQQLPALGLWSQPGLFSWDREDPGSRLLIDTLPALAGDGADFGCGYGLVSAAVLRSPAVRSLAMVDIDRRALAAAALNAADPRARALRIDLRQPTDALGRLDFVVSNPPFHEGGAERRGLGLAFVDRAAEALRPGGRLFLVANVALAYEGRIAARFQAFEVRARANGYKVIEAVR